MDNHTTQKLELSPAEKRAKLAQLLQQKASPPAPFPLSPGQQALWFLYKLAPESWAYNVIFSARICSSVDIPALRQAFQSLIDRHPSLRTTYTTSENIPVQQVRESVEVHFIETDASDWSADRLHDRLTTAARRPFDLENGPVMRVHLFTRSTTDRVLLLAFHHIAVDLWSLTILLDELRTIYADRQAGRTTQMPALDLQYADYVRWQNQIPMATARDYWQKQLAGELSTLNLPTDRSRPQVQTFDGASRTFELSTELTQQLKALARAEESTLYMTLLAAFQVLLYRYSNQAEILVCSPTAGRNQRELAGVVGYFINSVILKANFVGNPTFKALLAQVRGTVLAAMQHQEYPFSKLVEQINADRGTSRSSLFQVFFILQKLQRVEELSDFILPIDSDTQIDLGGLTLEPYSFPHQEGQFDLTLEAIETSGTIKGIFKYNSDLFDPTTIDRTIDRFQTLLADIVARPEQQISNLTILPPAELHQLLVEWNPTQPDNPNRTCIHQLFERQVQRTPDAVAVVFAGETLTYAELNAKANQLAHHLQKLGVEEAELVGICVERSLHSIVGILGILKAGGAYLPLDSSNPIDRLAYMLIDAQVKILVTESGLLTNLPSCQQIVCLDLDLQTIDEYPTTNPVDLGRSDRLAYVIYTSGSTGQPKGVLVNHDNVIRLFTATDEWYQFNERDVWTLFHSIAFDFSVWEIWGGLFYGGRVVVVPYLVSRDPTAFYQLLAAERVTVLNQTPSAFYRLIEIDERLQSIEQLSLRLIIFGGEALNLASLEPWFDRHGDTCPQLVNMYGITETTVHVTYRPLTRDDVRATGSLIGRPIPDLQIYLLDADLQPVPIGVGGEMYVAGAGVTQGYLQRAELTQERFIPNPFTLYPLPFTPTTPSTIISTRGENARLYKTGDLARYLPDGNLEYLGRIDNQVKIRGFRIELGEIEAVLNKYPEIERSTVIVREDIPGDKRLVAYVVAHDPTTVDRSEIRQFLQPKLPDYMVPSAVVVLAELPLTPNGKIDRLALPAPDRTRSEEITFVAPRNELEHQLVQIWSDILKIDSIGIADNFFELGGHSLLATQVISRIQTVYSLNIPLRYIFEYPTIEQFGDRIRIVIDDRSDIEYEQGQI